METRDTFGFSSRLLVTCAMLYSVDTAFAGDPGLGKAAFVTAVYSQDGEALLTASYAGHDLAQIWDVKTGREIRRFEGHSERLWGAAFGPEEKVILTAAGKEANMDISFDSTARVWDASTGRELMALRGHASYVHSATLSSDGKRILTSSRDATAKVWDAKTGRPLFQVTNIHPFLGASFSPDGSRMIAALRGPHDNQVRIWNGNTGRVTDRLVGHQQTINSVVYSPNGQWILTGSGDNTARIWDARTGEQKHVLRGHRSAVNDAVFGTNNDVVLTSSSDATVRLWETKNGREFKRFNHPGPVIRATVNSDRKRVLSHWWDRDGDARYAILWNAETETEIQRFKFRPVSSVAIFSPDGTRVLATTDPTSLWDAHTGKLIQEYE